MAPPLTSVTAALDKAGVGKFQWWLLTYTGLAWAADACEMMILSYLGPSAACSWPDTVGPFQESILTSVVFVGMLVGVYAMGALADTIGRKKGFLASALLLAAAGVASALSPSFTWLVILRGLLGLALGGTPIALTLFAEFLPSARRGVLVLLLQGAWTVGTCAEAVLAWLVIPTLGWRWLLALSAFPMIVLLAGYPLLPESPHWLVTQGRSDEAAQIVRRVAQVNGVALDVSLEEMSFLQASQPQGDGEGHGSSRIGQHDPHGTQEESNHSSHTATCSTVPQQRLSMTFKATFDFIQKATSHFFSSDLAVTTSLLWLVW